MTPAPAGFDAAIDAAFAPIESSVSTTDTTPAAPVTESADTPVESTESTETEETTEQAEGQDAPQQVEEQVDPDEEIAPVASSKDGKRLFFDAPKAKALLASHQTMRQLRELDPGITVENVKTLYERNLGLDQLIGDYDSGDPQRVGQAADWFLDQSQNPESVTAFVDHAVGKAAMAHPQAFQMVQGKILNGWLSNVTQNPTPLNDPTFKQAIDVLSQGLYRRTLETGNPVFERIAQNIDAHVFGRDFQTAQTISQQRPQQTQPDPERAAFERERQQYQALRQQDRQRQVETAVNTAETQANESVDQIIQQALSVIPENVKQMRAVEIKHAIRDLRESFEEARNASPTFPRQYNVILSALKANPSDKGREALVNATKQFAQLIVNRNKKAVLDRFTGAVVGSADAANKKQQQVAQMHNVAGATPVQRATVQQKLKDPNASYEDKFKLVFG